MAIETRINQDKTKSFRARVKDSTGKFYRSEWTRIEDEAMRQEAEQFSQKRRGLHVPSKAEGQRYTFDEFWEVYRHQNRTEVSEGWKISQDQMVRDYIAPVIGKMPLAEVGIPAIGRVLTRMKEMGRSDQLRKHVYTLMSQIFDRAAHYYKMVESNPVSAEYHGVKVAAIESRFLRPEQSWALLEVAREQDPGVWVELLAGLRTEAMVALTWGNVHWDANQILICRAYKSKMRRIEEFPKGKKAEYVPLTQVLKEYLWERFERLPAAERDGFVCPGPRGGMLSPSTYGPRLKRLCQQAQVPVVSPHILRHSCTELFVREGATQEDLRRLLNHKSGSTTLRYMHRTDDRLSAIGARIKRPEITHGVTQGKQTGVRSSGQPQN